MEIQDAKQGFDWRSQQSMGSGAGEGEMEFAHLIEYSLSDY